ncbi:MAG: DUF3592 domain-containing protein [Alphaproteobacteria bacterium]|nr:DUF3592 domain-containing protein [Alphaproteobacteria bacterium]
MAKLVLILLLLAVVIIVVIRMQGGVYTRFMAGAGEVMGKIEKKETRIDRPDKHTSENILIYSYVVDGVMHRGEERVEYDDLWMDAREGMELRVYYSKTRPQQSFPAAVMDRRLGIFEAVQ